jgi:DNA polymerase-3 subunit gamma/tau
MHELYKKYRPQTLADVMGNAGAVASLQAMIAKKRVPHAILLKGPSGCGKTTVGRILARSVGCARSEFNELDSAQFRGIDTIRELREVMQYSPQEGEVRVWLIDEVHKLTNDAQNAMLKMLEDTPSHVYFLLATTDPEKLIKAIHTRCTSVELQSLTPAEVMLVLRRVVVAEKLRVSKEVAELIAERANGSARAALVMLDAVMDMKDPAEMSSMVKGMVIGEEEAANFGSMLLNNKPWKEVATALKAFNGEPEQMRRGVLGYMSAVCLNAAGSGKDVRAFAIMCAFEKNTYDTGRAGLVMACFEACHAK